MSESISLGIILRFKDEASRGVKAVLGGIERLGEEAEAAQKRVAKLESGFRQLRGAGLQLTGMGIAAAGALFSVIKPAVTLEEAIKNTLTLTGQTGEAFARMETEMTRRALELSTVLGISANKVADSFYQVLSSGAEALSPQFDALAVTALKMAKTVGLAPVDAVEILSDTLHAFEMDVANAERAADVFFATSRLTATTVPQLTDAMREAAPAAASMGISLEETAAVLAGFAAKGVKGAKAGTAFRMILTRLAKPPADAAKALRFLGVSVFDASGTMRPMIDVLKDMQKGMQKLTGAQKAAALKAIAGEEAFSKLGGLLEGNLDTLTAWQKELAKGGALELAFSQKMEAASEQVKLLWVSIKNLATSIGTPLLDSLSSAARGLAWMLQGMTDFAKAHPVLGKLVGVTLAVVGIFGILAGSVLTASGMIGLFALKWLPLARAGMSSLSSVITHAIPMLLSWGKAAWGNVKAAVAWTASTIKSIAVKSAHVVSIVAGTVATWAGVAASNAAAAAQWLWNAAMSANPIGLVIVGIVALISVIVLLVKHFDKVKAVAANVFGFIQGTISKVAGSIVSVVSATFEALRGFIGNVFDWIAGKVAWVFDKVGAVMNLVKDVGGWLGFAATPKTTSGNTTGNRMMPPHAAAPAARAVIQPNVMRKQEAAFGGLSSAGAGGAVDQSIVIQPGAIQIHAVRVDDVVIREIDLKLAKLIRRRRERQ